VQPCCRDRRHVSEPGVRISNVFWCFLGARIVSDMGDRALIVILPFVALKLHSGAVGVSALLVASQLPLLLGLVLMSFFGHALPRRVSLVVSDSVQAFLQGLVYILLITDRASLASVVGLQAAAALTSSIGIPVSEASVANLVGEASRQRANAALQSGRSIVRVLAPGTAGALAVWVDVDVLFLLDALTFVVSAVVISALTFPGRSEEAVRTRMAGSGRFSAKAVRSKRWLVISSAGSAAVNALTVAPVLVLGPLVVAKTSAGPAAWGVLMTTFGVGGIVGAIILMRKRIRHPLRLAFMIAPAVSVLPFGLAAGLPVVWLCLAAFITGCQATVFNVSGETARQVKLEDELRVQGSAFASLLSFALNPVGLVVAGAVAASSGASSVLYVAAALGIAIPVVILFSSDIWDMSLLDGADLPLPRSMKIG